MAAASRTPVIRFASGWSRRRRKLVGLLLGLAAVASVAGWYVHDPLRGLPDPGDPFDVEAFLDFDIPDDQNAYVLYRQASRVYNANRRGRPTDILVEKARLTTSWSAADPDLRAWVEENRESLELWRRGSERPDALYHRLRDCDISTILDVDQNLRELCYLASLDASQRLESGDVSGAWETIRALLRTSRHLGRHEFEIERLIGIAVHKVALEAAGRWAHDPKVDASLLRRAREEVPEIDSMTAPASTSLKTSYYIIMKTLADDRGLKEVEQLIPVPSPFPSRGWMRLVSAPLHEVYRRTHYRRLNEPERSRRLVRQLMANWLSQCDLPPDRRVSTFSKDPLIYDLDPREPKGRSLLDPASLLTWAKSSKLTAALLEWPTKFDEALARERQQQSDLRQLLEDELTRREPGATQPDSNP